jgi:hypothetical protein
VQIPVSDVSGYPTVSPNQLRKYGAGGFGGQEESRGCPRQYFARYVEHRVVEDRDPSGRMAYGSMFHDVLHRIERDDVTPDEALEQAFPPDMSPELFTEARSDLLQYLSRGSSPADRYATIGTEMDLHDFLYEDDEHGPIWCRAILDWAGIDPEFPNIVHGVDYKTNQQPPSTEDVKGDIQLKMQAYLLDLYARRVLKIPNPIVIMHLDCVKWREIEITYSESAMEDWHAWATAVCRKILRDNDHLPVLNKDCAQCPVSFDCPAYEALPDAAKLLAGMMPAVDELEKMLAWRDSANKMRLLLKKAVEKADAVLTGIAEREGELIIGKTTYVLGTSWTTEIDLVSLHRAIGADFYRVVRTSKTAIENASEEWDSTTLAAALACISRVPSGSSVTRGVVEGDSGKRDAVRSPGHGPGASDPAGAG